MSDKLVDKTSESPTFITSEDELDDKPRVRGNKEGNKIADDTLSSGELKRKSGNSITKRHTTSKKARLPTSASLNLVSYGSDEEGDDGNYPDPENSSSVSSDDAKSESEEPSTLKFVISDGGPVTILSSEHKMSDLQAAIEAAQDSPTVISVGADDNTQDELLSRGHENTPDQKDFDATNAEGRVNGDGEVGQFGAELPPEPEGLCHMQMQNTVETTLRRMQHDINFDPNRRIQDNKEFRNPSIYKKLITFLQIDEKGTNFSSEVFNPYRWGPESFYDKLGEAQNREFERQEKIRKDRRKADASGVADGGSIASAATIASHLIRASSGPNLATAASEGAEYKAAFESRKKTKWDTVVPTEAPKVAVEAAVSASVSHQQHKVTIPALGNLFPKK